MEYYQHIQARAGETVAVINQYVPTMLVGTMTSAQYLSASQALDTVAQTRDDLIAAADAANNAEHIAYLGLRAMTLSLPHAGEGDLDENVPVEAGLIDLYSAVYSYVPRTTPLAMQRGQKLVSALNATNSYLAGLTPARAPVTSGGKVVADLVAALAAQPGLGQAFEDAEAHATTGRTNLRVAATAVDRLNKRAFAKLTAEGRSNPALAAALGQINTGSDRPPTLGIASVMQGGTDQLHVLVAYNGAGFGLGITCTIEWMVVGVDTDFSHNVPADPSGNALGPFVVGQTVKLRTRTRNLVGTTTSSVRTLKLLAPPA